ncbi:hypothetical protein BV898_13915 [Hypsibius exemplaris]|uniref:Ig-like domain-containing protein n=1 Tax=Hypsibius exemplaris TaxID=2072580 RepID=A0A1W0W9E4_HYPEX|nr:hypothetical protein BV898_13915 [Hypsibius exemplaris]
MAKRKREDYAAPVDDCAAYRDAQFVVECSEPSLIDGRLNPRTETFSGKSPLPTAQESTTVPDSVHKYEMPTHNKLAKEMAMFLAGNNPLPTAHESTTVPDSVHKYEMPTYNKIAKEMAMFLAGNIPVVGSFISTLFSILWPDSAEDLWEQSERRIHALVEEKILRQVKDQRQAAIKSIKRSIEEYREPGLAEKKTVALNNIIHDGGSMFDVIAQDEQHRRHLLPHMVIASRAVVYALMEQIIHGHTMLYKNTSVQDLKIHADSWSDDLFRWMVRFHTLKTTTFEEWKVWRCETCTVVEGSSPLDLYWTLSDNVILAPPADYTNWEVFDGLTDYPKIRIRDNCAKKVVSHRHYYHPTSNFVHLQTKQDYINTVKAKHCALLVGEMTDQLSRLSGESALPFIPWIHDFNPDSLTEVPSDSSLPIEFGPTISFTTGPPYLVISAHKQESVGCSLNFIPGMGRCPPGRRRTAVWSHSNGTRVPLNGSSVTQRNGKLHVLGPIPAKLRKYYCEIHCDSSRKEISGSARRGFTLYNNLHLANRESHQVIKKGDNVYISCTFSGDGIIDLQWSYPDRYTHQPLQTLSRIFVQEDALIIMNVTVEHSGQYSCQGSQLIGHNTRSLKHEHIYINCSRVELRLLPSPYHCQLTQTLTTFTYLGVKLFASQMTGYLR